MQRKGLVLVRLSMVVIAILVLTILMLSIVPLLQGGIKVELPQPDQTNWTYEDKMLTVDLNVSIYNGGLLGIKDFQFWVDLSINGSNFQIMSDSIGVDLKAKQWTEVTLPIRINLTQISLEGIKNMVFNGTTIEINGGMSTYAAAQMVYLSAHLLNIENYSLPSLISKFNASVASAKLNETVQGWVMQLPYELDATQISKGWNATVTCDLRNSTTYLGHAQKNLTLNGNRSDQLFIPISNETAALLVNGNDTLFFDIGLDLQVATKNLTIAQNWTGEGQVLDLHESAGVEMSLGTQSFSIQTGLVSPDLEKNPSFTYPIGMIEQNGG